MQACLEYTSLTLTLYPSPSPFTPHPSRSRSFSPSPFTLTLYPLPFTLYPYPRHHIHPAGGDFGGLAQGEGPGPDGPTRPLLWGVTQASTAPSLGGFHTFYVLMCISLLWCRAQVHVRLLRAQISGACQPSGAGVAGRR